MQVDRRPDDCRICFKPTTSSVSERKKRLADDVIAKWRQEWVGLRQTTRDQAAVGGGGGGGRDLRTRSENARLN